jgi:hypothetical protein
MKHRIDRTGRIFRKDALAHGRRNFKDTNPLMSSLLVIFVWGGEAILEVLNLVEDRV